MMKNILIVLLLIISSSALADCPHLYPNQKKIEMKGTKELCNSWYVSIYDERARKVVFVSELLNSKVTLTERSKKFSTDTRVKFAVRDSEYTRSGYDRGHLAPAGDASDQVEMDESFLLTNVVPQAPKLNRGEWKQLESKIRKKSVDSVYVITGAIYDSDSGMMTVPVPSAMYKAVYYKTGTEYWYADNIDSAKVQKVPKSQLIKKVGYALP